MGYYDTQHIQPNAGGQPYNVRDILLATQGVTGGLDKLVSDAGADRKVQQQMKANQYVSRLLGKATPENYQQQLLSAGTMAPYASPELMKQVDTSRAGFQRGEDIAHRTGRENVQDAQWGQTFAETLKQHDISSKQFQQTFDENKRQFGENKALQIRQMQQSAAQHKDSLGLQREQMTATQNALFNKPTSALITTADGRQVVRDVPYSAVIQGGYKDPQTGKTVSIQSLENVKATEDYTGIKTTKGAQQSAFAKIASDPQVFQDTLKKNLTSSIHGKQWITPKISETHMKEMIGSAGALLKSDPRLQALYNNATTDAQRGAVVKQAAGLIQEETNPFRRIGVGALNVLLPDEYEVDPYRIMVGDKKTKQNMQ